MKAWDLNQLNHFKAIFEIGNLSNTASHLGVTQSALTKSLKKLEESLNVTLFHRHTRELVATAAAHELYTDTIRLLACANDMSRKAAQLSEGNFGQVRIGCSSFASQLFTEALIERAVYELPDLRLEFIRGDFESLEYRLLKHEFDFFLYDTGDLEHIKEPERFTVEKLISTPMDVVISPNHPDYRPDTDYFDCKWALPGIPPRFVEQSTEALYLKAIKSGIPHYQIESMQQCLRIAKKGLALTVAPRTMIKKEIDNGELVSLPFGSTLMANIGIYSLRNRKLEEGAKKTICLLKKISTQQNYLSTVVTN